MGIPTNYLSNGADIGLSLVEKAYLIDNYPYLVDTFRFAGVWTWGANKVNVQLGDNTLVDKSSPVQTIAGGTNWQRVACGYQHTAAIKTDGTLWLWGNNANGQLGDNSLTSRSSPVQTISGGTNWKSVSCATFHTAAIKTDGTLWSWGSGTFGQLGDNTTVTKSSPIQTVASGTNWRSVSCGSTHTAAIKTDGTLWLWGQNFYGELGNNTVTNRSSPVQTISGGTDWKQVACGSGCTAAIKTDGTLWLWGRNTNGQLGDNTTVPKSSPVQTVAGGTNWKSVSCGLYHTAAIKTDGTLWSWGDNTYGQLGDGTAASKSSPVQTITGGTNWKSAESGGYHSAAIKTDGTLWLWGESGNGQLGDDTTVPKSSPVQTISGGTNWRSIASGGFHTAAIRDDSEDLL